MLITFDRPTLHLFFGLCSGAKCCNSLLFLFPELGEIESTTLAIVRHQNYPETFHGANDRWTFCKTWNKSFWDNCVFFFIFVYETLHATWYISEYPNQHSIRPISQWPYLQENHAGNRYRQSPEGLKCHSSWCTHLLKLSFLQTNPMVRVRYCPSWMSRDIYLDECSSGGGCIVMMPSYKRRPLQFPRLFYRSDTHRTKVRSCLGKLLSSE